MRPALAAIVLATSLALTGCFGGGGGAKGDGPGDGSTTATGSAGAPLDNATDPALEAPTWIVGQSWRWTLRSPAALADTEATTTVLAADGASYDIGIALSTEGAAVYPFHLVPLGPVDAATLAWQAHGLPVTLVRFPLVDKDTFTTDLWGAPGAVVVVAATDVSTPDGLVPGFRSTASYAGGGTFIQADYAPNLGQFVRVASYFGGDEPFAEATLTRIVDAPETPIAFRVTDLARFTANAGDPTSLAPRALSIPAGAELALLACFLPGSPGAYGAELNGAGTPSACFGQAKGDTEFVWAFGTATEGPATLTPTAVGQDGATIEAFAIDTTV